MIYLDYQATTPLAPEARVAMLPWLDKFANPHSPSRWGREAKAAIEVARAQVAALLPTGGRVAFTSGATEAINWAIQGSGAERIVIPPTEHAAVLDTARAVLPEFVPVQSDGRVRLDGIEARPGDLVAVMLVNNEIGVVQPVQAVAERARLSGALMLCDAVQGLGRVPLPGSCDLIAISAHKIHGPKGIGALWIRNGVTLSPLLHGGGQEAPGRSGTLSPMLCAGFGAAAAVMAARVDEDAAHVERLWSLALERLGAGWIVNGSVEHRYRGNLSVRRDGLDAGRLISEVREVAFSAGSACASGSGRPSHVLRTIGLTDAEARSTIRLGFGRYTTGEELLRGLDLIVAAADRQRAFAA